MKHWLVVANRVCKMQLISLTNISYHHSWCKRNRRWQIYLLSWDNVRIDDCMRRIRTLVVCIGPQLCIWNERINKRCFAIRYRFYLFLFYFFIIFCPFLGCAGIRMHSWKWQRKKNGKKKPITSNAKTVIQLTFDPPWRNALFPFSSNRNRNSLTNNRTDTPHSLAGPFQKVSDMYMRWQWPDALALVPWPSNETPCPHSGNLYD